MEAEYVTVVIRLPQDKENRAKIADALRFGNSFHGGEVTAIAIGDEMTVLDLIEGHEDFKPHIAEEARARAEELHATADNPA
jgi:hypothetical protein